MRRGEVRGFHSSARLSPAQPSLAKLQSLVKFTIVNLFEDLEATLHEKISFQHSTIGWPNRHIVSGLDQNLPTCLCHCACKCLSAACPFILPNKVLKTMK